MYKTNLRNKYFLFIALIVINSNFNMVIAQYDTSFSENETFNYDTTFSPNNYEVDICISEFNRITKNHKKSWKNEYELVTLDTAEDMLRTYLKQHFSDITGLKVKEYFDLNAAYHYRYRDNKGVVFTFKTTNKDEIISFYKKQHPDFYRWIKAETIQDSAFHSMVKNFTNNSINKSKGVLLKDAKNKGADTVIYRMVMQNKSGRFYRRGGTYSYLSNEANSLLKLEDVNISIEVKLYFRKLYLKED